MNKEDILLLLLVCAPVGIISGAISFLLVMGYPLLMFIFYAIVVCVLLYLLLEINGFSLKNMLKKSKEHLQ